MSLPPPPHTRRIEMDRRSANLIAEGDLIKTIQQYCITLVTLLKYTRKKYLFIFISEVGKSITNIFKCQNDGKTECNFNHVTLIYQQN